MHRPPRPAFKSTQVFPVQLRKIFTPDFLFHDSEKKPQEVVLNSMRNNINPRNMCNSYNQPQNAQCLQISQKNNKFLGAPPKPSNFHGKSFKIRNYTHTKIKQNTIPYKNTARKVTTIKQKTQYCRKNINCQNSVTKNFNKTNFGLRSYPHEMDLTYFSSKIVNISNQSVGRIVEAKTENCSIQLISENEDHCSNSYYDWMIIIHQSLFSHNIPNHDSFFGKLRQILVSFKQKHPNVKIVFKSDKEYDGKNYLINWIKYNIPIDYTIWGKHKYVQRVISYDLSQLNTINQVRRFIILSDILDLSEIYYYSSTNMSIKKEIDNSQKYCYLKLNGTQNLLKFFERSTINPIDDQIQSQQGILRQDTQRMMMLQEAYRKIQIMKSRQNMKKKRSRSQKRSNSIKQMSRQVLFNNQSKSVQQKNQQLRRKMIQYAKILQQDLKNKKKQNKKQDQKATINFFEKGNALKILQHKNQSNINNKSPYQLVYDLIKNNTLISKQIFKYQAETEGVVLQIGSQCLQS